MGKYSLCWWGALGGGFYPETCLPALSLFVKAKNCNTSKFYYRLSNANGCARFSICDFFSGEENVQISRRVKYWGKCVSRLWYALRLTKAVFNFTFWSDDCYLKKATEVWNIVKDMGAVACPPPEMILKSSTICRQFTIYQQIFLKIWLLLYVSWQRLWC